MLSTLLTIVLLVFSFTVAATTIPMQSISNCATIKAFSIPGAKLLSITGTEKHNITDSNLNICEVIVTLTHPRANDNVSVQIWLPLGSWNGRYVATGGGGWAAGQGEASLAPLVAQGYAASSTDAGLLSPSLFSPAGWALQPNGEVNIDLLTNFASRSVHDMVVIGKTVTGSFYGTQVKYSYWNGCSTGGRQGMVAAQKYPKDFDGILAGAPAIYWDQYVVAEHWPQVVMKEANVFPTNCELDAVTEAAIEACDELDGVKDNVISNTAACKFDPFTLVGKKIQCDGEERTITRAIAFTVHKIWDGPETTAGQQLWYALQRGAPLTYLANTTQAGNGTRTGNPFFVNDAWIRYFLKRDPTFDTSSIDTKTLTKLFAQSAQKYEKLIGSSDPDLSGLRQAGGKLLVWHGEADQLIFPQDSVKYRHEVERLQGGGRMTDKFFRLFLAPGVDHCGLGTTAGAIPKDPFGALVEWVESGKAPESLASVAPSGFTRKVCRYPLVAKFLGGDSSLESSYGCGDSF